MVVSLIGTFCLIREVKIETFQGFGLCQKFRFRGFCSVTVNRVRSMQTNLRETCTQILFRLS